MDEQPPVVETVVETTFDPYEDKPVYDDQGNPTVLSMPVQKMSRLTRDPGRGMMRPRGPQDPVYKKWLEQRPRDELMEALARDNSDKARTFLACLVNPLKRHVDICTLAKQHSIGLTEMMQIWRNYQLTNAVSVFVEQAPELAGHVIEDAKSRVICCPRCDGGGMMRVDRGNGQEWLTCVQCQGSGTAHKPGDAKSRDLVFKAVGILKNEASTVVNIQNNNTVESVLDELERLPAIVQED